MHNPRDGSQLVSDRGGIVIAADLDTLDALKGLAEVASSAPSSVAGIKLGSLLALRVGLVASVRAVRTACSLPVIYDHQKGGTDIPQMGAPFARACRDAGVDAAILFPLSGPAVLEAFVAGLVEEGVLPIVGLVMSHKRYLASEGGYMTNESPTSIAARAVGLGVRDFVLPATKLNITSMLSRNLLDGGPKRVYMPGVGTQGGDVETAVRAVSPHTAFPIVGSAIYRADDPVTALRHFAQQLRQ